MASEKLLKLAYKIIKNKKELEEALRLPQKFSISFVEESYWSNEGSSTKKRFLSSEDKKRFELVNFLEKFSNEVTVTINRKEELLERKEWTFDVKETEFLNKERKKVTLEVELKISNKLKELVTKSNEKILAEIISNLSNEEKRLVKAVINSNEEEIVGINIFSDEEKQLIEFFNNNTIKEIVKNSNIIETGAETLRDIIEERKRKESEKIISNYKELLSDYKKLKETKKETEIKIKELEEEIEKIKSNKKVIFSDLLATFKNDILFNREVTFREKEEFLRKKLLEIGIETERIFFDFKNKKVTFSDIEVTFSEIRKTGIFSDLKNKIETLKKLREEEQELLEFLIIIDIIVDSSDIDELAKQVETSNKTVTQIKEDLVNRVREILDSNDVEIKESFGIEIYKNKEKIFIFDYDFFLKYFSSYLKN